MSIGKKIFSAVGSLILTIVVAQGAIGVFMVKGELEKNALNNLTGQTQSVVDMLSDVVSQTEADLNVVRAHQAIQDLLTYLVFEDEDSMSSEVDKLEAFLKRVVAAKSNYKTVQLVGHDRTLMQLSAGKRTERFTSYDNKAAYKLIKQNSDKNISHTIQQHDEQIFLISIAALIIDNQTEGMLRLVQPINNKLLSHMQKLANQGLQSTISNSSGQLIVHSEGLNTEQAVSLSQAQLQGWASSDLAFPVLGWQVALGVEESEAFAVVDELVMTSVAVIVVAMLAATIVLGIVILRIITRPITGITEKMNDIAQGEGDLTATLNTNRQDEIGALAAAFNEFVAKMRSAMTEVLDCSKQLGTETEELDATTKQACESVSRQQAETKQVAAATTQLAATSNEVARITASAAEGARLASEETNNGQQVTEKARLTINRLASEIENTAGVVEALAEDSQNINSILGVINDIAEQTNLLALNAAIEAARAGEHGRGFAVVADEVRELANSTHKSTQQIHEIIERLQSGSSNAVRVMATSRQSAAEGVDQVALVSNSFSTISETIAKLNDENVQIASAAEEQGSVTEDVNRNIEVISEISQQTTDNSKITAETAHTLFSVAKRMQATLSQFKV